MARSELDVVLNLEDNLSDGIDDATNGILNLSDVALGVGAGAIAGIGAGLVAVGGHALGMAEDLERGGARAQTQLGLSAEEAEQFENVMRGIRRNNFGDDFDHIAESMVDVDQQFERIGGINHQTQLQRVTEQAIAIGDSFDKDVNETVGAAVTLMDTFGLTSDQAMGFVVEGLQRGLDSSGDFLDSIGEYSNQFGDMGADAGKFFSILEGGLQGGVLGTDKMADAFKEFRILFNEDSGAVEQALDDIGLSYDDLTQQVEDGTITQIDVIQQVIDKIFEIDDPLKRNLVGTALFGTQWEDLTEEAFRDLDTTKTKIEDIETATQELDSQYDTSGDRIAAATRRMDDALIPVGEALNTIKLGALELGTAVLEDLGPDFTDFFEAISGNLEFFAGAVDTVITALAQGIPGGSLAKLLFDYLTGLVPSPDTGGTIAPEIPEQERPAVSVFTNPRTGTTQTVGVDPNSPTAQAIRDEIANWPLTVPFPDVTFRTLIDDLINGASTAMLGGMGGLTINVNMAGSPAPGILRNNAEQGVMAAVRAVGLAV